jgi:hypothetical protein
MQRDLAERPMPSGPDRPPVTEEDARSGDGSPSRRALALEGLVVYLGLLLLTIPFLGAVRTRGQTFYNDVLIGFFGPEKHGLARLLRGGFLPVWLDNQFGGEPFLANLQHGVLYPGNLPFWVLPTSTALEMVVVTHLALAGLGMWAYCRLALRTSCWGAALAGLAFGLGSVALAHIILLNQLQVIAWMPLVLLFGHLALERGRLRWVVLTGIAAGLQMLAGHPEEWVYTLVALAAYGLAWTLVAAPRAWPRRALAAALRLGGAMVMFGLLFAWQLLPLCCCNARAGAPRRASTSSSHCPGRWPSTRCCPTTGECSSGRTRRSSGWSRSPWPGSACGPGPGGWAGSGSGCWCWPCSGS